MKITTHSRSTHSLTSTLLCLFALMTPGLCRAAAGGTPPDEFATKFEISINPPLHLAVQRQDSPEVQRLLGDGKNAINDANPLGYTVLHVAAAGRSHNTPPPRASDPRILEILLTDPNLTTTTLKAITKYHGITCLHEAARNTNPDAVRTILADNRLTYGIANAITRQGQTVLHIAAGNSNPAVANTLIADERVFRKTVELINGDGKTALHIAAENNNPAVLQVLLTSKKCTPALINTVDGLCENTALHAAAENTNSGAAHIFLCSTKYTSHLLKITNVFGKTALHLAAQNNDPDVTQAFLNSDKCTPAFIEIRDKFDQTALHMAAENSNPGVALAFLNSGKCSPELINALDHVGKTALHAAAENSNPDVLLVFINSDIITAANLNATINRDGNTILHLLAQNRDITPAGAYKVVARLLSAKNADGSYRFTQINALNKAGLTALQLAILTHEPGSVHHHALAAGEPSIFSALLGRAMRATVDKGGSAPDAIKTYGLDSDECQALLDDQSPPDPFDDPLVDDDQGDAPGETGAGDRITHQDQLRRTMDPNVGSVGRSPACDGLT